MPHRVRDTASSLWRHVHVALRVLGGAAALQFGGKRRADRLAAEYMRVVGLRQCAAPGLAVAVSALAGAGEFGAGFGNAVAGIGDPVAGIGAEFGGERGP